MKLHANAALSLTQRRRMVSRVLQQGWSISGRRSGRRDQRKNLWEVGGSLPAARESGLLDRTSAPQVVRQSHRRAADRSDRRAAAARFTGPEIAELLAMPLSTVSGILTRIGIGRLGRLGLSRPSATNANGRAS